MTDRSKLLSKLSRIEGWLRDDEALVLFKLAKNLTGLGIIVEIGSWKGKSTVALGLGNLLGKKTKIYAIDPHTGSSEHRLKLGKVDTFAEFKTNINRVGLSAFVKPLVSTSHAAVKKINLPIELLFIDGNHDYHAVLQDYHDWSPKLMSGGIIAFHDTIDWSGPRRVVIKHLYFGKNYKNIKLVGSLTYAQKTETLTSLDRFHNYYSYFLRFCRRLFVGLPLPASHRQKAKNFFQRLQ